MIIPMRPKSWGLLVLVVLVLGAVVSGCTDDPASFPGAASTSYGSIQGTVVQLGTNAPLENVEIQTEPPTVTVSTDAAGKFTISGIAAQTLRVVASRSSYVSEVETVSVLPGMTQQVNLQLQASTSVGVIQGTITDGVFALSDVKVRTTPATLELTTGADGRYTFSGIPPGNYRIDATRPGFFGDRHYTTLSQGGSIDINMALGKRGDGILDGYVRNSSLSPLISVQVDLYGETGQLLASAVTESNGRFTFSNLTTGFYTLSAFAVNYYVGTRSVFVVAGPDGGGRQIMANGDMILALASTPDPVPGALAGTIRDESYSPLSGVSVTLTSLSPTLSTVTDAYGCWVIANVSQGTVRIEAAPSSSYVTSTVDVLVGGGTTPDGGIRLAPQ